MKYVKQLLVFLVVGLLGFVLFYAVTAGLSSLFVFPILFLSLFLGYYLYRQWQLDAEENMKRGIRYAIEDVQAEHWMKQVFAPHTLSLIKRKHWPVFIYSFLIVGIAAFGWSYLSFGLEIAIRNFFYGAFLFWLFAAYAFAAQFLFLRIFRALPKSLQGFISGDWERAYLFLFPISFLIYLLYPFDLVGKQFWNKIFSFPVFLLIYTFVFLALYSLIYIIEDMQKDEEQRLEKEIDTLMKDGEK